MDELLKQTADAVRELKHSLPENVLQKHFELEPLLKDKYTNRQINLYREDTGYHLSYLAESIANNEPILFNEYLSWAKIFFENLPVTNEEIILNLELLRDALTDNLPKEMADITTLFINNGINHYNNQSPMQASFINETNPLNKLAKDYLHFLIVGDKRGAHNLIMKAVESGTSIKEIYLNVFQVTQKETGRLWQMSKISVAQEHFITAATQLIMSQLYPLMFDSKNNGYKVFIACVSGELHEIGARMVADLFQMEGWDSYYFGANVPQSSLLSEINLHRPDLIAISATMTFNLPSVSDLILMIRNNKDFQYAKILVGGYPFLLTGNLWEKIGADGYADDALGAIKIAKKLIS